MFLFAFKVTAFTTNEDNVRACTMLLLFLFGPAGLGFAYLITLRMRSPAAAQYLVIFVTFFIGLTGSMTVFILILINPDKYLPIINKFIWVLRLFPSFNLAKGLLFLINIETFSLYAYAGKVLTAFSPEIALWELIFLAIETPLYIGIVIWLSYHQGIGLKLNFFKRSGKKLEADALRELELEETEAFANAGASLEIDPEVANEEIRIEEKLSR